MKEMQYKIRMFCRDNKIDCAPEYRALDIVSEMGEVAKEILKMSDYGKREPKAREELKGEMGDLLFSVIALANTLGIDLEEALAMVIDKYRKRLKKGGAGSENG
jgi:NTP pyrophosphatase (non-canonical NTP hydrolase)